ncbi:MAG: 5-oxoprolinase subunit PxpA [Microbacteriaceae bacterium]
MSIDLNSDLGETWRGAPTGDDEAMFALISSANIACGFHAGDEATMRASVARAARFGVAIGAHPSYDDREHFGRRDVDVAPDALRGQLAAQFDALRAAGADIRYVKPHGALYNRIVHDAAQAGAVAGAVVAFAEALGRPLPLLGLGGEIEAAATACGIPFLREAFLDRGYAPDGTLVPRDAPGAVLDSAAQLAERAIRLVRHGELVAVDGTRIRVDAASLCVHGDTPAAVRMAAAVREALEGEGIAVRPPW